MLRLSLLGQFHAVFDQQQLHFPSHKTRALLAFLATEGTAETRHALMTLLWPNSDEKKAKNSLRVTLHRMKSTVAPFLDSEKTAIVHTDRISVSVDPNLWCDLTIFQACWQKAQAQQATLDELKTALNLYRGDFLAGFPAGVSDQFDSWLQLTRQQFHSRAIELFDHLLARQQANGNHAQIITQAQQQIRLEPWHENGYRHWMLALRALGRSAEALQIYDQCSQVLNAEFGIAPGKDLTALANELRGNIEKPNTLTQSAAFSQSALHNIPAARTPFFSRVQEIAQLQTLCDLPHTRLITLLGPGGVGKSRLAQETGRELANRFTDGVWFVPLVGIDAADHQLESRLASAIAQALSFTFSQTAPPLNQLIRFLKRAKLLLILDNLEHVIDASADLIDTLLQQTDELSILCTSREALNLIDEVVMPIYGLDKNLEDDSADTQITSEQPSVALFTDRAQRAMSTFTLSAKTIPLVTRISQLVDSNPLGLELAAAWTRTRTLTQIVRSIEQSADFLKSRQRNIPQRHRSMRAVFDTSWSLLDKEERQLFAKLTVFRGSFSAEAAQTIAGATRDHLDQLINKSLVEPIDERYRLHELLRQFGAEQRTDKRPARFIHYFLTLLAEQKLVLLGRRPTAATQIIEQDERNIWLAWEWALESHAQLPADVIATLGEFYFLTGRYFEGEGAFRAAGEQANLPSELRAAIEAQHARFLLLLGRPQKAAVVAQQTVGHTPTQLQAQLTLGEAALQLGQFEQAAASLQAAAADERVSNLHIRAQSLRKQGVLAAVSTGDFESAERLFKQAQQLFEQIGYPHGSAWALSNLGSVARRREQFALARTYYEQAHAQFEQIGHRASAARMFGNIGELHGERQRLPDALQAFEVARAIFADVGDLIAEADMLGNLAWASRKMGALDAAERYCLKALHHLSSAEATLQQSKINNFLGSIAFHQNDLNSAIHFQSIALNLAEAVGNPTAVGYALFGLALAEGNSGYEHLALTLEHANQYNLQALGWEARAALALLLSPNDRKSARALFEPVRQQLKQQPLLIGVEEMGLVWSAAIELAPSHEQATVRSAAQKTIERLLESLPSAEDRTQCVQNNRFYRQILTDV